MYGSGAFHAISLAAEIMLECLLSKRIPTNKVVNFRGTATLGYVQQSSLDGVLVLLESEIRNGTFSPPLGKE